MKNYYTSIYLVLSGMFILIATSVHAAEVSGKVDWARKVEMRFPLGGVVTKVKADTGAQVKKNALLASMDLRTRKAEVNKQHANLKAQQSAYDEAQRELKRAEELYDRTMLSDHDLQLAKNALVAAKAKQAAAQASLVQAKVALEHSQLRAPFAAIVLQRNIETGQAVILGESQPYAFLLAANNFRLAIASVAESDVLHYEIGNKVTVKYEGKTFPGVIIAMNYAPEKSVANKIEIRVRFENGDIFIMPGSSVVIQTL